MTGVRRYGVAIGVVGVVILAAFTGFRAREMRTQTSPHTASTATPLVAEAIRAEGLVVAEAGARVDVGSEIGGRITVLPIREQQVVHRGQVIAEIAADEARAALAEAQAQIVQADADTAWLKTEQQRATTLTQSGSVPRQTLDRANYELTAARARRAVAEATVRRLQATLAKTRIIAPIDGTIVSRTVELGEVIGPGTHLVTIVDLRNRRVEAEVGEYDAGRVRQGAPVTITVEGYERQSWQGVVESIPDIVVPRQLKPEDPGRPSDTQVLRVKITLPGEAPLKLGQRVELGIHTQ